MRVLPLALAVKPCLCQVALGRLKVGFEGDKDDDLRVQDAAMRREGEMDGAAGPVMKSIWSGTEGNFMVTELFLLVLKAQ